MYLLMPTDILELIYELLFHLIQWLWANSLFFHKDFFIIDGFMVHRYVQYIVLYCTLFCSGGSPY